MTDTTIPTTHDTPRAARATLAKGTALGVGLGLTANLVVFLVGQAGAPTRVITGWSPDGADLDAGSVAGTTIALSLVGALALWAFDRFSAQALRRWSILAAAVGVFSILPVLRLDIDAGSKVTLAVMHLVVAVTTIAGHAVARRSPAATAPAPLPATTPAAP
jgi:hypothetical protein